MEPIPFKLSVPGEDGFNFKAITSRQYKFRGFLRLDRDRLVIEWRGTAHVDIVAWTGIKSEVLPLPTESLTLSVDEIRVVTLGGGWIRPYLELGGYDLDALDIVPGEDQGRVRFLIARIDRRAAARLVEAISRARHDPPRMLEDVNTPRSGGY